MSGLLGPQFATSGAERLYTKFTNYAVIIIWFLSHEGQTLETLDFTIISNYRI